MKKPVYQKYIEYILYVCSFVVLIFAFYDGLSSSIEFINLKVAKYGTFIVISLGLVSFLAFKITPSMNWKIKSGQVVKVKRIGILNYLFLLACMISLWLPILLQKKQAQKTTKPPETNTSLIKKEFHPIFPETDTSFFNILIIRFETYVPDVKSYCIGRAIQEHFNVIEANEELAMPIRTEYVEDSIPPPRSLSEAINVQVRHNADIIIYGLANNISTGCRGAEICFRYNIDDSVVGSLMPNLGLKTYKHDLNYVKTSPIEIERGFIKVDSISLKYWIKSLVNIKAKNPEMAFLELAAISSSGKNLNDEEKARKLMLVGNTFLNLKQPSKAKQAYEKAIELAPRNPAYYVLKGMANYNLGNYQANIEDYTKALIIDSTLYSVYVNRGVLYSNILNDEKRARKDFKKAISIDSSGGEAFYNLGLINLNSETYHEAIENFNKAISLGDEKSSTYLERGSAYYKLSNFKKALDDFNKSIELDSSNLMAYNNRAGVYTQLNEYKLAIEDYTHFIEKNKEKFLGYKNRAVTYYNIGEFQKAIHDLNCLITIDSNEVDFYKMRGNAYMKIGEFNLALDDFRKSSSLSQTDTESYFNLGLINAKLQNHEEAVQGFSVAITLDSSYTVSYNNRGASYMQIGNYDLALKDFNRAIELDPKNVLAYNNRGNLYYKQNELELAVVDFQKVTSLRHGNLKVYKKIVFIYAIIYWNITLVVILLLLYWNRRTIISTKNWLTENFLKLRKYITEQSAKRQ